MTTFAVKSVKLQISCLKVQHLMAWPLCAVTSKPSDLIVDISLLVYLGKQNNWLNYVADRLCVDLKNLLIKLLEKLI